MQIQELLKERRHRLVQEALSRSALVELTSASVRESRCAGLRACGSLRSPRSRIARWLPPCIGRSVQERFGPLLFVPPSSFDEQRWCLAKEECLSHSRSHLLAMIRSFRAPLLGQRESPYHRSLWLRSGNTSLKWRPRMVWVLLVPNRADLLN